jgi:hypothetical protein
MAGGLEHENIAPVNMKQRKRTLSLIRTLPGEEMVIELLSVRF